MKRVKRRPIALIGLMGAGKTAVARLLGERLGASMADLDAMVEAAEGCSIPELFARSGEAYFRRREGELLTEVLRSAVGVLACGGGIVLDPRNRRALREHCRVVWLEVSPAVAAQRLAGSGVPLAGRPLLAGGPPSGRLGELLAERAALYAEAAHQRVDTDGRSAAEVVAAILEPKGDPQ